MSFFPTTREGRRRLVVTALGAYIIGVPIVGMCSRVLAAALGWNNFGSAHSVLQEEQAHRYSVLGFGYILCLVALFLFLPALTDLRVRRAALAIWALGALFLVIFIYPMTLVLNTK